MNHISFKKILVPVDFSETSHKAFHHVKWLAQKFSSEVTLIHIGEQLLLSGIFPSLPLPDEKYKDKYKVLVLAKLEELKEELLNSGIKTVYIQYLEGNVAESIDRYAKEEKMDMVAMGTHGSSGFAEFFMGSNAFKVVNFMDMPVLTINEKQLLHPIKILLHLWMILNILELNSHT